MVQLTPRGLWANTYAMSTVDEYFAEGTQSFFNVNPYSKTPNGIHGPTNTKPKLLKYDPVLYGLVKEVFPCENTYLERCKHTREAELNQKLKMNCKGGETSTGGGDIRETTPTPSGSCKDNSSNCRSWSQRGECKRNPGYM